MLGRSYQLHFTSLGRTGKHTQPTADTYFVVSVCPFTHKSGVFLHAYGIDWASIAEAITAGIAFFRIVFHYEAAFGIRDLPQCWHGSSGFNKQTTAVSTTGA